MKLEEAYKRGYQDMLYDNCIYLKWGRAIAWWYRGREQALAPTEIPLLPTEELA